MRQLNKIVFINSATIRYQEVLLDGNVHFIGTQGVGKSTLLRAILFFYNGDTQKLGIPREKKIFAEYYFPNTNSYILYEVERETGSFTVLVMRSGAGVVFRFIDSAYNPEWILRDNQALEKWGDIRQQLDKLGIDSSNRVDRLMDYRDIIYGNPAVNAANRKYALLESKQYQNIPRTITNVFLNTKLEAGFIKETIIHSLSEEELVIDLMTYRHHLHDFEKEYVDIQNFTQVKTQDQAEKIIAYFNQINERQAAQAMSAAQLGNAVKQAEKEAQSQKTKLEIAFREKNEKQKKSDEKEKRQANQVSLIRGSIKSVEAKIREAQKKEREYNEKGITEILNRVSKQDEWLNTEKRLGEERSSLTAKFESIEQAFQVRKQQLDNGLDQLVNEQEKAGNLTNQEFQNEKEKQNNLRESQISELQNSLDEKLELIHKQLDVENEALTKIREKRSGLKAKVWYADEIQNLKKEIFQADKKADEAEGKIELHKEKIRTLKGEWEREEERLVTAKEVHKVKLDDEINSLQNQLASTQAKLDGYKNALYGYLQEHYPDWQETIGRIAREDILFNEDLQPELKKISDLFFGLELKLQHVDVTAKTLEQYELEKKKLTEALEKSRKGLARLDVEHIADLDKLTKRFRPKIREHKDATQKWELEKQQSQTQIEKKNLLLEELEQKANTEKDTALAKVETEIEAANAKVKLVLSQVAAEKNAIKDEIEKLEKSFAKLVKAFAQTRDEKQEEIERIFSVKKNEIKRRIAELLKQQNAKLKDAGADTARLNAIDAELQKVILELQFISENQELVIEYRKDKRELFDRIPEFKKERDKENGKLENAEGRLDELEKEHRKELAELSNDIKLIEEKIRKLKDGFDELEQFSKSDLFKDIETWMEAGDKAGDPYAIRKLIDEIRDISLSLNSLKENLRDTINRFLNRFSDANLFHFPTSLSDLQDYMAFAANLKEFIDENKIAEYQQRVERRFASILSSVSRETGDLISREGDIQKVVSNINRDFRERNFVGVIQSMELRLEDSASRVVNTLKRIREYEQEQGHSLGEHNLFNAQNGDANNKRAVEFLNQLNRDILESKRDRILLSDAFELRFRVVENENDSGWVEKLSNVGSEGTDVLVKAMINILLLNVFKNSASRKFKDFRLHCMMDEVGRLHPTNVRGILKFANDRNILLINGSPVEQDAMAYRHIYELRKDKKSQTQVRRLITVRQPTETQQTENLPDE
ncbi:ATP-binding protein [Cryomorpha ignava]|uniref:ATP-binding protein n=1 Tax=Cryomorpha ignava TaxID=101383 RepID=A0A7K3WKT9_9FLAO|nr:ATP-binding protein [Cryomorpha ignava]NEN22263.1 ATP-binding protein [Cryomorpha ignava]